MTRFFFDTYDGFTSIDEEGVELPNLEAVRDQVRKSLPAMLKDEMPGKEKAQFRMDVRDSSGVHILTGTVLLVIDCFEKPAN